MKGVGWTDVRWLKEQTGDQVVCRNLWESQSHQIYGRCKYAYQISWTLILYSKRVKRALWSFGNRDHGNRVEDGICSWNSKYDFYWINLILVLLPCAIGALFLLFFNFIPWSDWSFSQVHCLYSWIHWLRFSSGICCGSTAHRLNIAGSRCPCQLEFHLQLPSSTRLQWSRFPNDHNALLTLLLYSIRVQLIW